MINLLRKNRISLGHTFNIFGSSGTAVIINVSNLSACNNLLEAHVVNFYRSNGILIGSISFEIGENTIKQIIFNVSANENIYVTSTAASFMGAQCYISISTSIPEESVIIEDGSMDLVSIGVAIKLVFGVAPTTTLNLKVDTLGVFPPP
jgi:hypothetical protein